MDDKALVFLKLLDDRIADEERELVDVPKGSSYRTTLKAVLAELRTIRDLARKMIS